MTVLKREQSVPGSLAKIICHCVMHLLQFFSWTEIRLELIHLQMNTRKFKLEEGIIKEKKKVLRPLNDELKMKYAFPSGFQGSQLSGYLPNNKLSVSCVDHRKLLLAKNLYGDHRPPPGVCPALLAASERIPELRVPQPPPLFTRVSLSLVHKSGSLGAKVPLEQTSRRATLWEENHINQKAWLCGTGQESPC